MISVSSHLPGAHLAPRVQGGLGSTHRSSTLHNPTVQHPPWPRPSVLSCFNFPMRLRTRQLKERVAFVKTYSTTFVKITGNTCMHTSPPTPYSGNNLEPIQCHNGMKSALHLRGSGVSYQTELIYRPGIYSLDLSKPSSSS